VSKLRYSPILVRVLYPVKPLVVTRAAHLDGISKGLEFTGRIQHEIHAASNPLAHGMNGRDLQVDAGSTPAMDLEGGVAALETALSIVRVSLR